MEKWEESSFSFQAAADHLPPMMMMTTRKIVMDVMKRVRRPDGCLLWRLSMTYAAALPEDDDTLLLQQLHEKKLTLMLLAEGQDEVCSYGLF